MEKYRLLILPLWPRVAYPNSVEYIIRAYQSFVTWYSFGNVWKVGNFGKHKSWRVPVLITFYLKNILIHKQKE